MPLFIIAALIIALGAIVFALQNPAPVVVNFLVWQTEGSLALVFLITLAVGVLIGLLVFVPTLIRRNLKISHQKRQTDDLGHTVQDKDRELSAQRQHLETFKRQAKDKLQVFSLTEPQTGLLAQRYVTQVTSYLLERMKTRADDPRYNSISVLMVHLDRVRSEDKQTELSLTPPVLQTVAQILEAKAYPESWLHSDGQSHFISITPGLDDQTAADYGELLRTTLGEVPIELPNRSHVFVDVSVGGAIADATHPVDSAAQLLEQAEDALMKAEERGGKNRYAWFGLGRDRLMWN